MVGSSQVSPQMEKEQKLRVCVRVCVSAFLTVRVRVSQGAMIKAEEGNIKSELGSECGEIAHSAGPAVSLMTSLSCGFHENQTCRRSCFHTKPSSFCDPSAFILSTTTKLIVWLFLHNHFSFLSLFLPYHMRTFHYRTVAHLITITCCTKHSFRCSLLR